MRYWIIAYDISDPKRLQHVHRAMIRHATPIEYSVFLLMGTENDRTRCLDETSKLIDDHFDDLRCYPLPERGLQARIGKATLPAGIHFNGLPGAILISLIFLCDQSGMLSPLRHNYSNTEKNCESHSQFVIMKGEKACAG